jgi:multidrug transporter EmrE-like cation transporter
MNFLSKMPVGLLLALSATSVIIADFFAKYWSIHQKTAFLVIALLGYLFSGLFYTPTLLKEGLIVTSMLWSVASITGFILVGWLIFKESLSPTQLIGVILGAISLIILAFFD